MKRKTSKIKKQQSRHGAILQGSDHKLLKSVTTIQSEEEDVPDDEEQENIKKMKEKVQHKIKEKIKRGPCIICNQLYNYQIVFMHV